MLRVSVLSGELIPFLFSVLSADLFSVLSADLFCVLSADLFSVLSAEELSVILPAASQPGVAKPEIY
jgi:hypothetical protein